MQSTAVNGAQNTTGTMRGMEDSDPLSQLASGEMNPESIIEMLKKQLGPEAAMLLDLLVQMLKGGQDPFQSQAPAAAPAGGPAGGGGGMASHGAAGASPVGKGVDGGGGFLWKPQSESDGNLVVLLPPELRGQVDNVRIEDQNGNVLDQGRFAGDQKNGGRPHFRFGQPGGAYGEGLRVVASTKDGREMSFDVGKGAERHD